jgi:hypothetical protein
VLVSEGRSEGEEPIEIEATDEARVWAYGTTVIARLSAKICIFGKASAGVRSGVSVWAYDTTDLWGNEISNIYAHDRSQIMASGQASVVGYDNSTVLLWNQAIVEARHGTEVKTPGN